MVGFQTVSIQQELNFSDVLILWDSGLNRTAAAERWRNAYEFSIKGNRDTAISIYVVGSKLQGYGTRPKGGMGRLELILGFRGCRLEALIRQRKLK